MSDVSYRTLADEIARDIASGHLKAGDKLPPHRDYAYKRGIAVSTAGRVYRELVRRGLIVGEVGRGSFVRDGQSLNSSAYTERSGLINLESNIPILDHQDDLTAPALASLTQPEYLALASAQIRPVANEASRDAIAAFLTTADWQPQPDTILVAGSGRRAIAGTLAALAQPGDAIAVEAMTYSVMKGLASRLGLVLVPVAQDSHGLVPEALEQAYREHGGMKALYVQPSVHNPLNLTMPTSRRKALAATLQRLNICAIEDAVYGFLAPKHPPLATLAPDHVVYVDSLSKRIAPGLSLGLMVVPPHLRPVISATLHSGGWSPNGLNLAAAQLLITKGVATELSAQKVVEATRRQDLAQDRLAGLSLKTAPHSFHCWLELPAPWRAETFAAAAVRRGIAITPGAAFAIGAGHAPNAVRVALGMPPIAVLADALSTLRTIALTGPDGYAED